jgi:ribosomal protein S18
MNTENGKSLVERFLRLMEVRDLETAESLMAPGAKIIFPGDHQFASQREVVAAASGRYQWIKKRFEDIEAFQQDDGIIVYVRGTLYGINLADIPFADIRFIDRFVVENGRIAQQDVWNDLAETGVLSRVS